MKASKKCPHCGQWSTWNQEPTDLCQHCLNLLDPVAVERQQAQEDRREEEKKRFTVDLIQIKADDSAFTKIWKSIGLGFQLAFVGIVSFILWLIALLAG
ncbi:hypothetical protein [Sabulibacter ruber]|uniref:hypothetical protein n=1 Tax=Sabulibacter ruber TaxID=2811901 RepID=UPI001A962DE0|nr:hypothetical protein [Sabulibacter ruber]